MARMARTPTTFPAWTWTAVLAGVFTSLVVQILLTMLGFGVGLLSIDIPTASEAPRTTGHLAFAWWAVSGVIAAFSGGAVAAANSPDQTDATRETTGQARPTQAQIEEARQHFAYVMLASFVSLLLGGFAAYGAGMA